MNRKAGTLLLLAALGGSVSHAAGGEFMSRYWKKDPSYGPQVGVRPGPVSVLGLVGPQGQPVPQTAPYSYNPGREAAWAMPPMAASPEMLQTAGYLQGAGPGGIQQVSGYGCGPGGCGPAGVPGAVAAVGALTGAAGAGGPQAFVAQRTEVRFVGPSGMKISWYTPGPAGAALAPNSLEAPARYNFLQGAIYRLKLSDIPNRPGLELYPTLEVVPANGKTATFIAHAAVPVLFTEEDFEQVAAGNFLVKVIYLPDPQFQDLATTGGLDEVVSTRLEPGVDPIAEACRRGSILVVVRLGNIDLEAPNTPAMDAPNPFQMMGPGGGMMGPGGGMNPMLCGPGGPMGGGAGMMMAGPGMGGMMAGPGMMMPGGMMMPPGAIAGQMLPPGFVPVPQGGQVPGVLMGSPAGSPVKAMPSVKPAAPSTLPPVPAVMPPAGPQSKNTRKTTSVQPAKYEVPAKKK